MEEQEIRKKIKLKYECELSGYQQIFGKSFVKENKENIELIINEKKIDLIDGYKLKKGENNIILMVKKKNCKFKLYVS